jgi:hypothetical protein
MALETMSIAELQAQKSPIEGRTGSENPRPNDARPSALWKKMLSGTAVIPNHEIKCFSNSSASARSPAFLAALIVEKNSGDCATAFECPAR